MTETLCLQRGGSISLHLPNKPDFVQEVDTFSQKGNKIIETTGVLNRLKINMFFSVLLYWSQKQDKMTLQMILYDTLK